VDGTTTDEEEERLKAKEDRQKRREYQRKFLGDLVGCGREVVEEYKDAQIVSGKVLFWLVVEILHCANNLAGQL
jgi:hypothetical protein